MSLGESAQPPPRYMVIAVIKAWKQMIVPPCYSAPLHSVLKCTVSTGVRVKTSVGFLSGSDYYDLGARPCVCAPCVFGDMCLRHLTREELAEVLDVPSGFVRAASISQLDALLTRSLTPLNLYSVVLMHLFVLRSGGGCDVDTKDNTRGNDNGEEVAIANDNVEEVEDVANEKEEPVSPGTSTVPEMVKGTARRGSEVDGRDGRRRSELDSGSAGEGCEAAKTGGKSEGKRVVAVGKETSGEGRGREVESDRGAVKIEQTAPSADERNQLAVKSDGAAVPTYIWHQHLFRGLQSMASASPFALGRISSEEFGTKAAMICDRFLLPCWQKLLLQSFIAYFRCKKGVTQGTPSCWIKWNAYKLKYELSDLGQARYVEQWQHDRAKGGVDLEAAVDCIQRGVDASWWEWKGGPALSFGDGQKNGWEETF